MSLLPFKTVTVQIKLGLWRPGTLNCQKYPNPKYHQRCHHLSCTRTKGKPTKFLTLKGSETSRLPVCVDWQTLLFITVWVSKTVCVIAKMMPLKKKMKRKYCRIYQNYFDKICSLSRIIPHVKTHIFLFLLCF